MEFNKEDVEKFYKFLNHAKFTEVRIIDPRIGIKEVAFVDNLNDFLAVCERYNGQANVYVSVNERSSKEGKAENVSALQIIPLDIDPVRPKGQASTDAELEVARQKMLEIKKWLKENFHCTPFTNMSGNGFHLFMKIPAVPLDQFNRPVIEEKLQIFVHGIQEKFNDEKVHIDSTFDLPRVMKCPGTMSVKGDNTQERPRRMCQIIDPTDVPSVGVLNHLVAIQKPEKAEGEFKLGDKGVKEFVELLEKDQKLRDLVMGDWKKYSFSSRSEAEQSLLTKLVAAGFSEQSINTIMMKSKIGKWKEKTDAYRHRSIEKAIEFVEEHKEAIEPVKYKQSCGEDLESKVCEQISNNEFIVYDKTSGQTTNERTVDEFKPYEKIIWKPVDKATDYKSEQELWSEVKRFIYEHMDVSEGYDVLTAWVLMSWVPERWKAVPYLFFFGPKGSGKSRALEILGAIGFRPFLTGSASLAAIFRLIQMWHVTLFLDETEIYMKKDYRDVQNLLNTGYRRGWPTVRVEEDREGERIPVQFDTFGPKALAGTKELLDTLKSRCVVFGMSKAIRDIRDEIDEEWAQSLREKLLMYRFSILTKKELPEKPKLFKGRLRELFDPLIIVAPLAEKNPIIQQAKKIEGDLKEEEEMSLDAIVFKAIMKVYQETQEEKLLISDISKIVNEKLEVDEMVTNITVGMTAKRLGFQKCLKGGARAIRWNKELAERLIMRYGGIESQKLLGPKRFRKGVTEWLDWGLNEAGR